MEGAQYETLFRQIYLRNFSRLKRFAREYIVSDADAENILQDVFMILWERRKELLNEEDLTGYLLITTRNKCIDLLRKRMREIETSQRIQEDYFLTLKTNLNSLEGLEQHLLYTESIEEMVNNAINLLPEKCRRIFIMNKLEGKKQRDIAEELNISINTVETQMSIAYKKLKEILKDRFILLIIFFM